MIETRSNRKVVFWFLAMLVILAVGGTSLIGMIRSGTPVVTGTVSILNVDGPSCLVETNRLPDHGGNHCGIFIYEVKHDSVHVGSVVKARVLHVTDDGVTYPLLVLVANS